MAKINDFNSVNPVNQPSEKICKGKCGKMKPFSEFNNNRTKRDGKQEICRQCQSEFMRDYNAQRAYAQKMEKAAQLTAGDVQLDPAPKVISAPKKEKKELDYIEDHTLPRVKADPTPKKVNLPDKKVSKQAELADPTPSKVNLPIPSPVYFSNDEKRTLLVALEKYIGTIDSIIAKLT